MKITAKLVRVHEHEFVGVLRLLLEGAGKIKGMLEITWIMFSFMISCYC